MKLHYRFSLLRKDLSKERSGWWGEPQDQLSSLNCEIAEHTLYAYSSVPQEIKHLWNQH